ncbi:hypothetical protein JCM5296_004151 [Sporobolomyces johnsonii]
MACSRSLHGAFPSTCRSALEAGKGPRLSSRRTAPSPLPSATLSPSALPLPHALSTLTMPLQHLEWIAWPHVGHAEAAVSVSLPAWAPAVVVEAEAAALPIRHRSSLYKHEDDNHWKDYEEEWVERAEPQWAQGDNELPSSPFPVPRAKRIDSLGLELGDMSTLSSSPPSFSLDEVYPSPVSPPLVPISFKRHSYSLPPPSPVDEKSLPPSPPLIPLSLAPAPSPPSPPPPRRRAQASPAHPLATNRRLSMTPLSPSSSSATLASPPPASKPCDRRRGSIVPLPALPPTPPITPIDERQHLEWETIGKVELGEEERGAEKVVFSESFSFQRHRYD